MNLSIPKRFLIITAAAWIGALAFFVVLNIFQFAPKDIDPYFRIGWIFSRSLLQFLNYLVPIQCTAVLYTFSVLYPKTRTESGMEILTSKNFSNFVTVVIIILLSLTALYFTGTEVLKPRLHNRLDTYSYLTKTGRTYYEQAQTALREGKLFEAESSIKKYLAIKPDEESGISMFREISSRLENQYSVAEEDEPVSGGKPEALDLSYDDALKLARRYLDNEDFYSAYYYARIASELGGRSSEAAGISSEAWTRLSETAPSREEAAEYELFSRKKRGTDLLLAGRPIEAYYLFSQLNIEHPDDPDVSKYLNESIRETVGLTYFIDEAEEAMSFPGISEICFLNINNDEVREIVYFEKMVTLNTGTYISNIESVAVGDEGVISHMTAKYGKLNGDHLILNGIDRENRNIRIFPEYHKTDRMPELYNTLKLNPDRSHIASLHSSGDLYRKMNIIELIELEPVIAGYGWMVEPLHIEIITRILNPCGFIILSLVMIAIGWKYRRLSGRVTLAGFILLPAVIYVTSLFSEAWMYGIRLLCSIIFLNFGRAAAISLLGVSQLILFITAFLLIAGLRTSEAESAD